MLFLAFSLEKAELAVCVMWSVGWDVHCEHRVGVHCSVDISVDC